MTVIVILVIIVIMTSENNNRIADNFNRDYCGIESEKTMKIITNTSWLSNKPSLLATSRSMTSSENVYIYIYIYIYNVLH